jgi:thiol-disulfide isomerase/thioredoxin
MSDVNTSDPAVPGGPPPAAAETVPEAAAPPQKMGLQAKVLVAALAIVVLVALFWPRGDGSFEAPGGFLTDAQGRPQTLGPRMAQVTLVHFWATWCPPCLTEIPTLDRLQDDYAGYRQFDVLMVAVQDEIPKVQTFLGDRGADVLFDHNWEVAHRYGTRLLPETYLVVGGQVVEKWEGAQDWGDPELRRRIDEALREAGAAPAGGET